MITLGMLGAFYNSHDGSSYLTLGGVFQFGVRRGCAPVLGSFWPENSGIGI